VIHLVTYSNHHDVSCACGATGWLWDGTTDTPGVLRCDDDNGTPGILFTDEPIKVTCPACLPAAEKEAEGRAKSAAVIAAEGGIEAMHRRLLASFALRRRTGATLRECRLALLACGDDEERAIEHMRRETR
jgi:hypothetical protein